MLCGVGNEPVGPEIGRLLAVAHKRAARTFAEALEPLGLDGRLYGVLLAVARGGPMTQAQLVVELDTDKSAMLRTVDELEDRGLCVRQPVPGDRRARAVALTPAGRARVGEAGGVAHRVAGDLFGWMPESEQVALRDLLTRFVTGPGG
jgi:MarR family transcriptional regulator, lower aerobic nicotinate degradation pathway regulator